MTKFLKDWALVLSIFFGILFNSFLVYLAPAVPYLISIMLFLAFAKVDFSTFKLNKMHCIMFVLQISLAILLFFIFSPFNDILAQGAMMCVLIPTAASASVVVGMLGGSIASVATYTLFSNIAIALLLPIILSLVGIEASATFMQSIFIVGKNVLPIFILPLILALIINNKLKFLQSKVSMLFPYSFYLWAISLMIVMGKTFNSLIVGHNNDLLFIELSLAVISFVLCILQFYIGRKIGKKFNDTITAGQSFGQKNTIVGIWLSHMYLHPYASIAPACYVIWQNFINSYEIWKSKKTK